MSVFTSILNLFKYDPVADKKRTYNIQQALNDNWDKIDAAIGEDRASLTNLLKVGGKQPAAGPCFWFDTGESGIETVELDLDGGADGAVATNIDGVSYAARNTTVGDTVDPGKYNFAVIKGG